MKTIDSLKKGDYIAFGFNYNGGKPNEIIVDNITEIIEDLFIIHFTYGHHSLSEVIKKEDILAIGDLEGTDKISGWVGNYNILQKEKLEKILSLSQ